MALRRLRAKLALKGDRVSVMLLRGTIVHDAFEAHAVELPNPPVPLPTLKAQIGDLEAAQLLVATRVPNNTASRTAACNTLRSTLELYRAYLQNVADSSADPATVIENGGMKVAKPKPSWKPLLDARMDAYGAVVLRANAGLLHKGESSRFFNWQYTLDGGATWITVPPTTHAQTSITGLPSMTTCGFRVSVTAGGGQSEWSQPVSLLVVH